MFPTTDSMLKQLADIAFQGRGISPFFRLILVLLIIISIRKKKVLTDYLAAYVGMAVAGAGIVALAFETRPNLFNFAVLFPIGLLWGRESLVLPPKPRPDAVRIAIASAFGLYALFYPHFGSGILDAVFFAPLGMVPAPTLVLAMAVIMATKRAYTLYAAIPTWIAGILYGLVGVFYLKVSLDWVVLAAVPVSIVTYLVSPDNEGQPKGRKFKRRR